jgi:dipeptidyl aminopeptidase/acylaminoacyl peptidase
MPEIEHLWFAGRDGTPVEGWYLKPQNGAAPYPTVLYIHGGPHIGFGHIFSFDFLMLTGAGYGLLAINQRGSSGYGDEFSTGLHGRWGDVDYGDLMAGVDHAIDAGLADANRVGCCGLSGGGYLTCWIVGQTDRFRAAVPENPVTNWISMYGVSDLGPDVCIPALGGTPSAVIEAYWKASPVAYAHQCKTPTLLLQAETDYRCPAEQSEQFYALLKQNGCPVEMMRFPGGAHAASITGLPAHRRSQNLALLDWMRRYL